MRFVAQTLHGALHAQAPHARCGSKQAASSAARATSAARLRVTQQPDPRLGHFHFLALAPRLVACSLVPCLRSRAMAAVDVSRVVALTNKAATLKSRGHHHARAAEKFAVAVAAAQALQQPDCVIVAHLQASHANALLGHANTAGVPETQRMELPTALCLLRDAARGYGVAGAPPGCWHAPNWRMPAL
jgi:hypothetical protein